MDALHPFVRLRRKIRQSCTQFRHADDNSESLFHPDKGFVYAYQMQLVEAALDQYEQTLDTDFSQMMTGMTPEERLVAEAKALSKTHPSKDTRHFAQAVLDYIADQPAKGQVISGPFEQVRQA